MEKEKNHHHKEDKAEKGPSKEEKQVTLKEEEYLALKEEAQKSKDCWERLLRLQAEFDNARKRWEREKQDIMRFANEDLVYELLNVVDNMERSLELAQEKHEDFTAFLKGVEMILSHLHDLFKRYGVTAIDTKGKLFDPNFHEALMQIEKDDLAENTIVEELQKGYLLNSKVIRTAKVKVSKKSQQSADNSPQ